MTPRRLLSALCVLLGAGILAASAIAQSEPGSTTVPSIELSGDISPATEAWIGKALDEAAADDAPLAIIRLDTPGGLGDSMREIVKDILAAPMPVVVYVSPDGARAGSAGVFITQAGDVAAMAPDTNIGSASPIDADGGDIEGTLGRKITNDAAAFVRTLAETHGRDPELAEEMVEEATNVTAEEALDAGLIDLIAGDQDELLAELDGFEVQGPKEATLETEGLTTEERDMPLEYDLLQLLVNPNIAFILLLLGFVGIALEIFSPGAIVPGAVGATSLLLGIFGSLQLPVEAIGIVLLLLAAGMLIAEAYLPTGGLLGFAGVGALIAGGLLLYDIGGEEAGISTALVIAVGVVLGGAVMFIGQRAVAAQKDPIKSGSEHLVGEVGDVRQRIDPIGQVYLDGSLWRARAADGEEPIEVGYRVTVESIDGLTLTVAPVDPAAPVAAAENFANEPGGS